MDETDGGKGTQRECTVQEKQNALQYPLAIRERHVAGAAGVTDGAKYIGGSRRPLCRGRKRHSTMTIDGDSAFKTPSGWTMSNSSQGRI